jgi:hypothetical protein
MENNASTASGTARLAGFLFLWLIVSGLTGAMMTGFIAGSGTYIERASRIVASEHLYRIGLSIELIETISALVLGFLLYVILKPVNKSLAQLAFYFRLAESIVGAVGVVIGFAGLNSYSSYSDRSINIDQVQSMVDLTRSVGVAVYNVAALLFSFGSLLFFYLFYKSRYIPTWISIIGLVASVVVIFMCFGSLIFPEIARPLKYGWAPMAIAEISTGIYLMSFGVRTNRISNFEK